VQHNLQLKSYPHFLKAGGSIFAASDVDGEYHRKRTCFGGSLKDGKEGHSELIEGITLFFS